MLPLLLQLPTRHAILIAAIGLAIALATWRHQLPAWLRIVLAVTLVGLVMSASRFMLGRDTGCALLAAMLALKPVELSTLRDARSLLGFALFAPFSTFLLDQGPASLALGLLAATLVLAAMLRLADVEACIDSIDIPTGLRVLSVWRLIAIGLPVAMAAFWLFPRISSPLWGVPERALARPGLSDHMSPGEWLDLMADDTPVLRATFFGAVPTPSQLYWRGPVLWDFDGRTWTQPQWLRALPAPPVTHGDTRWDYEVEIEPTDRRQLIALELPTSVPDGAQLGFDYALNTATPMSSLTRWRMQAAPAARFEAELSPLLRRLALRLPEGYNPRTLALGRQWRREAGPSSPQADTTIIKRALQWVKSDFAYTLSTPYPGRDSVDEFLFDQQVGFCQHFSSSFVVLMRATGIPARVVTGYAGGYRNPFGGYWLVKRSDAHAWAEVWLSGRGWVRVDPTAAVAPDRIYDTLADRSGGGGLLGGLGARFAPVFDAGDWLRRGWNDYMLGFNALRQQQLLKPLGIDRLDDGMLIALFAAVGGVALGWMLWLTTRSEREPDPLLRAWHRLGRRYDRLGLGRATHESAGDWATRVVDERPQSFPLHALSQRFADWRYAVGTHDRQDLSRLLRDLHRHRP